MAGRAAAEGRVTRGTTGVNRLRRVDRYLQAARALRTSVHPFVVDLGFGARPWTALELAARLARTRDDVEVLGLEIDRARVEAALPHRAAGVDFAFGGFEVPTPGNRPVTIIRAMNVLRQYDEGEVAQIWARLVSRLEPGGLLLDGTCDELGRICSWVDLSPAGPERLTLSLRLADLERPGIVAERLPKALIHHNVPGEPVHAYLTALDAAWQHASPRSVYGPVQRFVETAERMRDAGWPIEGGTRRWRLGELSVPWHTVAPTPLH